MNLTDKGTINNLLKKHGFNLSKSLGQNFLINPEVCPQMIKLSGVDAMTGVIEIGPGIGVLTAELCKAAKKVAAIELDTRLLPILNDTLRGFTNFKIINDDVLKIDLAQLIESEFGGSDVIICANLPYYITSPVIMNILESKLKVKSVTVMVQKEAAQRICAAPGTRPAGSISYTVSYYSEPEILLEVPASSFMPSPKVDSCVIKLNIRESAPVKVKDEEFFFKLIRCAFGQRRKTLLNALSSGIKLPKEELAAALERCVIPALQRGEKLTLEDFALLSETLGKD